MFYGGRSSAGQGGLPTLPTPRTDNMWLRLGGLLGGGRLWLPGSLCWSDELVFIYPMSHVPWLHPVDCNNTHIVDLEKRRVTTDTCT